MSRRTAWNTPIIAGAIGGSPTDLLAAPLRAPLREASTGETALIGYISASENWNLISNHVEATVSVVEPGNSVDGTRVFPNPDDFTCTAISTLEMVNGGRMSADNSASTLFTVEVDSH